MRTAIRNTTIVTADARRTVHHDATLIVEDDKHPDVPFPILLPRGGAA